MDFSNDQRIVLTLDAGGTNFVFSALAGYNELVEPVTLPSEGHDLDKCLNNIKKGFDFVIQKIGAKPISAISFAFPGPADYPKGIIGDLGNLPAFRGGIALGPMLENIFKVPVFINNDGNLYAYGEAIAGFLPEINNKLTEAGSGKRFKNIIGLTLGTGFGAGLVTNEELVVGDNSNAGEVWLLSSRYNKAANAEEGVSIRAVKRLYADFSGDKDQTLTPEDIYLIGIGEKDGDRQAAMDAYAQMGKMLGDALSNLTTLFDGLIVLGGGVSGAKKLIVPAMLNEMRGTFTNYSGDSYPRLAQRVYYLDDISDMDDFIKGERKNIKVPGFNKAIVYDPLQRIGIGFSKIGTSKAIGIGAYAFALNELNKR